MLAVLLAGVFGTIMAVPAVEECPRIMSDAGLSPNFAPLVTHSIHSMTVEDIRFYFKPDATEDNGIPTVNQDVRSEERILRNAPLAGYDDDFTTKGLKSFDLVMRNMNRTWWGIPQYSLLEKVAHALHMAEAWENAVGEYKMIQRLLDPESDICACVRDIENNGVLNYLNLMAFKIRYPGITSGNATLSGKFFNTTDSTTEDAHDRKKRSPWKASYSAGGYSASYSAGKDKPNFRSMNFDGIDFELSDVQLLKDVSEKLVDHDIVMLNHIDNPEHWEYWKNILKLPREDAAYYDIAMFMFCMLN